jgi:asparagine synthetase B (glutamine-hydrolysing)
MYVRPYSKRGHQLGRYDLSNEEKRQYSEYLLFRSFYTGFPVEADHATAVFTSFEQIRDYIIDRIQNIPNRALMLSGGMDSAALLPCMGKNAIAYTIFHEGRLGSEVETARRYCKEMGAEHRTILIKRQEYIDSLDYLMHSKNMPLSPAEAVIYLTAKAMKKDGFNNILMGSGDPRMGGFPELRGLHSKTSYIKKLKKRYFDPKRVLRDGVSVEYVFDQYLVDLPNWDRSTYMNGTSFINDIGVERFAHSNAVQSAGCQLIAPYKEIMVTIDEKRNRRESKYILRELFKSFYGYMPPLKIGMEKPVDFLDNFIPLTPIFNDLNLKDMKFPRKFLLYCLDRFHYLKHL